MKTLNSTEKRTQDFRRVASIVTQPKQSRHNSGRDVKPSDLPSCNKLRGSSRACKPKVPQTRLQFRRINAQRRCNISRRPAIPYQGSACKSCIIIYCVIIYDLFNGVVRASDPAPFHILSIAPYTTGVPNGNHKKKRNKPNFKPQRLLDGDAL
jgi:hypothetical protein